MDKEKIVYAFCGRGKANKSRLKAIYSGCNCENYTDTEPEIINCVEKSDKKKVYCVYITEVLVRCEKLLSAGNNESAVREYKFMIDNLKKEFNI